MTEKQKTVFYEEGIRLPSREEQYPVILAFQRIVLKRKTNEGEDWKPRKILRELWLLWEKKPKGEGYFTFFHDEYYERVSNLRRAVNKTAVQDSLFFYLIELFVNKHAQSGDYTPYMRDINLVKDVAIKFDEFAHGPIRREKTKGKYAGDRMMTTVIQYIVGGPISTDQYTSVLFKLTDFHKKYPNLIKLSKLERQQYKPGKDFYLAIGCTEFNRAVYWPVVVFDTNRAQMEIGFFSIYLNCMFTRSVGNSSNTRILYCSHTDIDTVVGRIKKVLPRLVFTEHDPLQRNVPAAYDATPIDRSGHRDVMSNHKDERVDLANKVLNSFRSQKERE